LPPLDLPHPAKAHQRDTRCWRSASLANLIEQRSTVDEVCVATERHEARGLWWSLRTFCGDKGQLAQRWSRRERALAGCKVDSARVVSYLQPVVAITCKRDVGAREGHRTQKPFGLLRRESLVQTHRQPLWRATLSHHGWVVEAGLALQLSCPHILSIGSAAFIPHALTLLSPTLNTVLPLVPR
jgi:hypothetical protein